jgi:hypothetical protein
LAPFAHLLPPASAGGSAASGWHDHAVTWEQFTDLLAVVLPIVTLILCHVGTRLSDRWRERQDRERDVLRRVADREDAALVELQDLFPTLPVVGAGVVNAMNDLRSDTADPDASKRYVPLQDALARSHRHVEQARVLATRVTGLELRQTILDAIEMTEPSYTEDEFDALFQRDEQLEYWVTEAWDAVRGANEAIGARL